ncbi:UNVERIFIED_CONTAM: hypothetical protein NCL1_59349 [Trichonephila clavipes]
MSLIANLKKDELKLVAEELHLTVPDNANILDLKSSLEKAFKTKEVPEEWKSEILLNILGDRANKT